MGVVVGRGVYSFAINQSAKIMHNHMIRVDISIFIRSESLKMISSVIFMSHLEV